MLKTSLSGKYTIGNDVIVNVGNSTIMVKNNPVKLRRQVFHALLLLMEYRLHESAVPADDFSKTLPEEKQVNGDVISDNSIRKIVKEINDSLKYKAVVASKGIGYYLEPDVTRLEVSNETDEKALLIYEKLYSVIDNLPGLIEKTMMMAFSSDSSKRTTAVDKNAPMTNLGSVVEKTVYPNFVLPSPSKTVLPKTSYKEGDTVLHNWQLIDIIGNGSNSSVFLAHRLEESTIYKSAIKIEQTAPTSVLERQCAKDTTVILTNDSSWRTNEIEFLNALKGNSYIVNYEDHEVITISGEYQVLIIRMELLKSIEDIKLISNMTEQDVIHLGIDICKALELCFDMGIIHSDVKPSNIYLNKWGGYKLGDFSAASKVDDTALVKQVGTLRYMAPEVYRARSYSFDIDTYSLGMTLYQILNRMHDPLSYESRQDLNALSRRLAGEPLPVIPGASNNLMAVISKACSYLPADRYQKPSEMRIALESL